MKDTLLYAGSLDLRLTDWFFFKNDIQVHYLGLQDGFIHVKRTDSTWNYAFIGDAFSSTDTSKSSSKLKLAIEKMEFKHFRFMQDDGWRGEDMHLQLRSLDLTAKNMDLEKRIIDLDIIHIKDPLFSIKQYDGKRPAYLIPKDDEHARWNPDNWVIKANLISVANGTFASDIEDGRKPFNYFDADHIRFEGIQAQLSALNYQADTVRSSIKLSAKEKSGFIVQSLKANWKFHPKAMAFDQLEIITPNSNIGNSFTMKYRSFNDDMKYFISRVKLEGNLKNAHVSFKDIAYFAPQVADMNLDLTISGKAEGTIGNFWTNDLVVKYGKATTLKGSFSMSGLPESSKFKYLMEEIRFNSNIADLNQLYPGLGKIKGLNLNQLGNIDMNGILSGDVRNLYLNGLTTTAIGNVNTRLTIKDIASPMPLIESNGEIIGLQSGKLLNIPSLETATGKYTVRSDEKGLVTFNSQFSSFGFNGYAFNDVKGSGTFQNNLLKASLDIGDHNLEARVRTQIDLKGDMPHTVLDGQVLSSNLQALKIVNIPLRFAGRTHIDMEGDQPDNIKGDMRFYDLIVFRNDQAYVVDSLHLHAEKKGTYRVVSLEGEDLDVNLQGNFDFATIGNTFNQYFSKYYPMYFKKAAPLQKEQDFSFDIKLKNTNAFLKILNTGLSGFNNSRITGGLNTRSKLFNINADIPKFSYNKLTVYDYELRGEGTIDSLKLQTKTSSIVFNDSLFFPNNEITVRSSKDISQVDINTFSEQSHYGAKLSASVQNLTDGIRVHFNPSSLVFNEKTWLIEKDGEIQISRSRLNASNFKISNGEQVITALSLPPEASATQNIVLSLTKVNLGDLLPFVLKEPRIQGITTGDLTIEDPFNNLKLYLNAQTDKTRFEEDSIGITTINAFWDNKEKRASYFLESDNPAYLFGIKGKLNLKDSISDQIDTDIDIKNVKLSLLQKYLGIVFSDLQGVGNGKLRLKGKLNEPDLIGDVKVSKGKFTVAYTNCTYTLEDPTISFKPDQIDFGTIQLKDAYGNPATLKGSLEHHFFSRFSYNISATSKKMLVLNTRKENNGLFYGKAIAKFNFSFTGPESEMKMAISGAPVDSSNIDILTSSSSKQTADVDYILWKTYGKEMRSDSSSYSSNMLIDLDLTASPLLRMNVILDELTGDIISGIGNGNLKIHTGTKDNLTMLGRYNIESGSYNFNFQDIFKKPFKLVGGGNSYISWTGDPYDAEINIDAVYLAEKVRMSTLFTDPSSSTVSGVSSDVLREISDVEVRCNLSGTLSKPNPAFQIVIPQNSSVKNNATIDSKLKTINRDALEVSKQATYLIVFKSFAPQAAVVASDLNSELINNTISGVINGILSSSVQNFFSKVLGAAVDVNLNYSRTLMSAAGANAAVGNQNNFRENVSLQFIKSLLNDKLVITFGSDFNFSSVGGNAFSGNTQSFLFLPDVSAEYKITPDGKFRTSFFYRSSFDLLSTSGKRDRTGGNVSFRTEFDRIFEKKKKKTEIPKKEPE